VRQCSAEFGANLELTRESLNPLFEEAVRRGIVRLAAPVSRAMRDALLAAFLRLATTKVNVVETAGPEDNASRPWPGHVTLPRRALLPFPSGCEV
jgi:DNA-binding transcriptional regulator LsrR (DeoR family)